MLLLWFKLWREIYALRLLTSSDFVDILNYNKTYGTIANTTPVSISKLFSTYNKVEVMIQKVYYSEYPGKLLLGQQILWSVYLFIYLFPGKKVKATVWEVWCTSFFYLFRAFQVFTLCTKFKASYSRLSDCLLYFSVGEQYRCKKIL